VVALLVVDLVVDGMVSTAWKDHTRELRWSESKTQTATGRAEEPKVTKRHESHEVKRAGSQFGQSFSTAQLWAYSGSTNIPVLENHSPCGLRGLCLLGC